MPRWLLPERISDILPSEARRIEELRRVLLDLFRSYGYELVMPPLLEYLDSLAAGSGPDLGLRTFQLIDQLSGRTLGLRADFSPQVARIDAHLLGRAGVTRLCYSGSVLHARPAGLTATREPIHAGVEIYGHAGVEADVEVIELMVRAIQSAQTGAQTVARTGTQTGTQTGGTPRPIRVDLCHMGIVSALLSDVAQVDQDLIYALLQSKDAPELAQQLTGVPAPIAKALLELTRLHGPARGANSVLRRARERLPDLPALQIVFEQLERLINSAVWDRLAQVELLIDFADLRSYRYHNGISFAAYVDGLPSAVARGGRYDGIGLAFGRARPATGFSIELRELAALATLASDQTPVGAILAPWSDDLALLNRIAELRASGRVVIQALPGHEHEWQEFACVEELFEQGGRWQLRAMAG
jgi:ATP phosphoribosyltransferase regulatory subunit